MPASTSSPPPQHNPTGLKGHASYDPTLPSSPEVERLTPVPNSLPSTAGSPGDTSSPSHYTPHSNLAHAEPNGMNPQEGDYMDVGGFDDYLLNGDFTYFQEQGSLVDQPAVTSATTLNSKSAFSRQSTGLATQSSQLMSPELSDAPSPETPREDREQAKATLFGTAMSRDSTYGSQPPYMVQTPATTVGNSSHISPDLGQAAEPTSAPRVQVESYTRGDSPARSDNSLNALRRKRSHGSQSSLRSAVENGSSDDDYVRPGHSNHTSTRIGLEPSARQQLNVEPIMSVNERVENGKVEEKNKDVSKWLSVSDVGEAGLSPDDISTNKSGAASGGRLRAQSAVDRPRDLHVDVLGIGQGLRAAHELQIPGPGALLDERSGDEDEGDETMSYVESAPPSIDELASDEEGPPKPPVPEYVEPGPEEASPWVDPIPFPSHPDFRGQPESSTAALELFNRRARDIETSSRVATWGTGARRMSDGDLQTVFGAGGLFSRLSISKDRSQVKEPNKDKEDGWNSFKETVGQAVDRYLPKRIPSTSRRKQSEPSRPMGRDSISHNHPQKESLLKQTDSQTSNRDRKESLGGALRRISSTNKRPPHQMHTTAAVASTTSIATLGASASVSSSTATSPVARRGPFKLTKGRLSRHSSQDSGAPSLAGLLLQQGGPPVPNLTSQGLDEVTTPISEEPKDPSQSQPPQPTAASEEEEEDEQQQAVAMNLAPQKDMIVPTFEGFKTNIRNVNPRLPPWLVERLGQEQLRRYKKLVEFKVKHAQHVANGTCPSGDYCVERGGAVTYFPSKAAQQKDPKPAALADDADEYKDDEQEGLITDATFPPGVPMPPVKRLPAEFECPLCFQVKKLQKPSDWSKHVHEDLQPFTCTFGSCADPKSFKRKADWVRHENERHRQLEWWRCTEEGCAHQCFRRDNFVQHLVREHKMPEPKSKVPQPNKKAVRGPAKTKPRAGKAGAFDGPVPLEDRVLHMVEECRHENPKNAIHEPCRFCSNVCNSFKKLTVHLARHMEQISVPVLDLVKAKDVTAETVISPIESRIPPPGTIPPGVDDGPPHYGRESISIGPFEQPPPGVPEIPGLVPIPGAGAFQGAPPYRANNFPQWSGAGTMPAETVPLYGTNHAPPQFIPAGMAAPNSTWIPQSSLYSEEQVPTSYGTAPPMQNNPAAYARMDGGGSPALATTGYGRGPNLMEAPNGMESGQQALSPTPAYGMNHSPHLNHSPHMGAGMPMEYDGKSQVPYSQAPPSMAYQPAEQPPHQQHTAQQQYYRQY